MITVYRKFTTKIIIYGISSFHFTVESNSKSSSWPVHSVQETSQNLRRPTRVDIDNTADDADITQSQAANHHRLLSHVTLGFVVCMK